MLLMLISILILALIRLLCTQIQRQLWSQNIQKEIKKNIGNKNITTNIYRIQDRTQ